MDSWSGEEGLSDLLARVDAVSLALPPDVQADLAVRASDAGVHVLLDKPSRPTSRPPTGWWRRCGATGPRRWSS